MSGNIVQIFCKPKISMSLLNPLFQANKYLILANSYHQKFLLYASWKKAFRLQPIFWFLVFSEQKLPNCFMSWKQAGLLRILRNGYDSESSTFERKTIDGIFVAFALKRYFKLQIWSKASLIFWANISVTKKLLNLMTNQLQFWTA